MVVDIMSRLVDEARVLVEVASLFSLRALGGGSAVSDIPLPSALHEFNLA